MFKHLKKLFDSRSSLEKTIDRDVKREPLRNDRGTLNRRLIPALIVANHSVSGLSRRRLRYATVCVEHRLKDAHPDVASNVEFYNWTGGDMGPESKQFSGELCLMATTDFDETAPLGVHKSYSFDGTLSVSFYSIESTEEYIDAWFELASVERDTIEDVVVDLIEEYSDREYSTIRFAGVHKEATETSPKFRLASKVY